MWSWFALAAFMSGCGQVCKEAGEFRQCNSSAAAGIGLEVLKEAISTCEASDKWWEAAQLNYALSTTRGLRGGEANRRNHGLGVLWKTPKAISDLD